MKALTIKNPWAWLIAHGIKDVENRSWKTNFRGRIYIHSSAEPDQDFTRGLVIDRGRFGNLSNTEQLFVNMPDLYPNSQILGSVAIVDCVQNHPSVWADKGCWNWVLADPILGSSWDGLKIRGTQSFWELTPHHIIK